MKGVIIILSIEIRKLPPALVQDYARFFDTTPHNKSGNGDKCYCITFCKDGVYHNGGSHWYSSLEERKLHGIQRVQDGDIQGYLAYCNGEVVGWCNSNTKADCLKCFSWRMMMDSVPTDELAAGTKVKSVFCFLIASEMRRKGIAKMFLERVCQDAAQDGFDIVEAYPYKKFKDETKDFLGPVELFIKNGFTVHFETNENLVMRKKLNTHDLFVHEMQGQK